ncbi:MAG TPA: metalloregulator ArsR/SmtB family transcription factor [Bellilinea sp.]|nr:metalloregulator ArsR/SmtB family transcription factor [Bellilinea sp.]
MLTKSVAACEENIIHLDEVQTASRTLIDSHVAGHLAQIFSALSDPTRLRIISALSDHELCVCDLAVVLGMSQSAVSHQLRLLRNLNLVKYRKEGRVVYYALDDEHIRELYERGLEHVSHQIKMEA